MFIEGRGLWIDMDKVPSEDFGDGVVIWRFCWWEVYAILYVAQSVVRGSVFVSIIWG